MTQDFDTFFKSTGVDDAKFANDVAKAKTFGLKFQETFQPEVASNLEEMKQRAQRLNAKEPVVLGLPNSFVYLFVVTGLIYMAYNIILD